MAGPIIEALVDTGRLMPLLAAIYFLVAFLEYRYGEGIDHSLVHLGAWAPVAGAVFGCIPQCGFSVIAAALFVKRLISAGTLLAVFISTSDEAVPILLSMPEKAGMVGGLIATKVVLAIVAGMAVDRWLPAFCSAGAGPASLTGDPYGDAVKGRPGCCDHGLHGDRSALKALWWHPLRHTLKIAAFLLVLTAGMNIVLDAVGKDRIALFFMGGTVFQPAVAAVVGLIPNCFASVLLAELFARGVLSFGSLVAGLSCAAGLGLLVLVKENTDRRQTAAIVALLVAIAVAAGIILQIAAGVMGRL